MVKRLNSINRAMNFMAQLGCLAACWLICPWSSGLHPISRPWLQRLAWSNASKDVFLPPAPPPKKKQQITGQGKSGWWGLPTPLKNMKVSWCYYSQYMEQITKNHQPEIVSRDVIGWISNMTCFLRVIFTLKHIVSDIVSDIPSGSIYGTFSDILSDILSGIYPRNHSGIYSDSLSGILSGILQFPIDFCGLATTFKVPSRQKSRFALFCAGLCAVFASFCALFACMFRSWMYQFAKEKLWREKSSSKFALKFLKFSATAVQQVALPLKNWVEGWHLN